VNANDPSGLCSNSNCFDYEPVEEQGSNPYPVRPAGIGLRDEPKDMPDQPNGENGPTGGLGGGDFFFDAAAGGDRPFGWGLIVKAAENETCARALGATSGGDAKRALYGAKFERANLGEFKFTETPNGQRTTVDSAPLAATFQGPNGAHTIQVNENLYWHNPQNSPARNVETGHIAPFDWVGAISNLIERPLSTDQFRTGVVLHELRHVLGAPQETSANRAKYNQEIYDSCLK